MIGSIQGLVKGHTAHTRLNLDAYTDFMKEAGPRPSKKKKSSLPPPALVAINRPTNASVAPLYHRPSSLVLRTEAGIAGSPFTPLQRRDLNCQY